MSALVTPEGYADLCTTTLTAGYTAGAGAITVASTGAPFPQVQQFHFFIQDQTTLAVKAVGKATAITSGTVWAVTMSTDANANSGDFVKLALAQDAMDQIRKDSQQFGTFANLPTTTGQKQGNRYKCTDAPFDYIFNGSIWQAYFQGTQVTPITTGNWSTLGASGTRNNGSGTINIVGTTGATNVYGVSRTVAAGDFSHTLIMYASVPNHASNTNVFAGFTDGTKVEGLGYGEGAIGQTAPNLTAVSQTALTGGSSAAVSGAWSDTNGPAQSPLIIRLSRTGTALKGEVSFDNGISFVTVFNDTVPFLTASSLAVYVNPRGSTSSMAGALTLISSTLV